MGYVELYQFDRLGIKKAMYGQILFDITMLTQKIFLVKQYYKLRNVDISEQDKAFVLVDSLSQKYKEDFINSFKDAKEGKYVQQMTECLYGLYGDMVIDNSLTKRIGAWIDCYITAENQFHDNTSYELEVKKRRCVGYKPDTDLREIQLYLESEMEDVVEDIEAWIDIYDVTYIKKLHQLCDVIEKMEL